MTPSDSSTLPYCRNCRFFLPDPTPAARSNFCRRYPPTPFLVHVHRNNAGEIVGSDQISISPVVSPEGTCGEWTVLGERVN